MMIVKKKDNEGSLINNYWNDEHVKKTLIYPQHISCNIWSQTSAQYRLKYRRRRRRRKGRRPCVCVCVCKVISHQNKIKKDLRDDCGPNDAVFVQWKCGVIENLWEIFKCVENMVNICLSEVNIENNENWVQL